MQKIHEEQLIKKLQEKIGFILDGIYYLKLGPCWSYKIVNEDKLEDAGYFQILLLNEGDKQTFCTYKIENDSIDHLDIHQPTVMLDKIDELTEIAEQEYKIDVTAEVIFWPNKGYWMKFVETNDYWHLNPGKKLVKQKESKLWGNKKSNSDVNSEND